MNLIRTAGLRKVLPALTTAIGVAVFGPAAIAGDDAEIQVLGFSKNGSYFAFEQYGVQDGSGFPYSEIFVLDVIGDSWVEPSPFRRRDDINDREVYDEDLFLSETRAQNRATAQPLLQSKAIAGKGKTVGINPRTELSSDPHKMVVSLWNTDRRGEIPLELTMEQYPISSAKCEGYGTQTSGFRLTMTFNGVVRTLNEDKSVPSSRLCPHAYRIERIVTHYPDQAPPVFAILIQMDSFGFEGPDRRYLAITGRL
ncbi:DUF2259 domain-containing protein [Roseibium sp. SCPC15]|uniref:DUF2259 domain-containing protein n=1 Tax=Roseibium sp. SCP15 TaxID=3141376 RepID=UPI00333D3EFA